jgi:hypothetical protein
MFLTFISCILCISFTESYAQTVFKFNGLVDIELSKAGEKSHYYYNEIDQDNIGLRIGVSQLNLMGQLSFNSNWSFNTRLLLERNIGKGLNKVSAPQLNFHWVSNNQKRAFTFGLFTNPFGSFNEKQISTKRNFIGLPLAYSYYANISSKIGYVPDMGDVLKVKIDQDVQWGSSNLYYGGYTGGAMFSWNIKPSKINLKLAIVNGAANKQKQFSSPINFGVISRLKLQPKYFWEQGFSVSHGSFMQESEVSDQLKSLNRYTQTLFGTDFKLGTGFLEFSGELIGSFYKVPHFNSETLLFESKSENDPLKLSSFSGYLDLKYELPILPGSYIAYRFDHLRFGQLEDNTAQNWDNNVLRHSLAFGYHLNQYVLARIGVSTQQVENKSWNTSQGVFRFVLTAHY